MEVPGIGPSELLFVVIIAIAAGAITPPVDPVNMGLVMMMPMTLLYFASIDLSYLAYAGRQRSSGAPSAP